jgi:formylglycine-generating enzyme required for sulfatase activity
MAGHNDREQYEQAVFISYAWGGESEEIVNQIDQALQQRGLKAIRDKRDLGYRCSISAFMQRIGQGNCVIVVISDKYLRSPNCMFEMVEIAEGKQFYDRVFPIVLSDAIIYDPVKRLEYVEYWELKRGELAQAMKDVDPANLQGIREDMDLYDRIRGRISGLTSILKDMNTLTPDLHRDSDFDELYAGIERRMAESLGLLKPESGESPYMGLHYYDRSDADLFYGREVLTRELLARVQKESFLAIVGASGSGKSSVVRAGLIPAWETKVRGGVLVITPTAHPLESVAVNLTRDSETVTATSTLMDDMQKDDRSLRLYVRKMLINTGETNLMLVVDQFEETFTLCKNANERKSFIGNLLSLAAEEGKAHVVITLRADFYHHCAEYEGLRLVLEKHQAYIGAMTQDELREAITAPAEKYGWDFQSGLIDLILQDVGAEPGALPLLSHALLETWQRRHGRILTLQGYADAGGVKKAIAQTAESVYEDFSPSEQKIARSIFLRLTELGESTQDTRRRVKIEDLAQVNEKQDAMETILQTLVNARLVTTEEDGVEVTHEALIREWGTLRKWLDEDREGLRLHQQLSISAHEWKRRGCEASELYRGTRLKTTREWAKEHSDQLNSLEQEFLKASQKTRRKEHLMRWTGYASVGILFLCGFTILFLLGRVQYNHFVYKPVDMNDYWVTIPAGEFQMGTSAQDIVDTVKLCQENTLDNCNFYDEVPQHSIYLNAYQIGKFEITYRQYDRCVKASVCGNSKYPVDEDKALYPVAGITWSDAKKYCEWVGGRLPTEAEWEKAARGTDGRFYPWGNLIDCSHANYYDMVDKSAACVGATTPVGSYKKGISPFGIYDMTGNVEEWVNDWYDNDYYQKSPSSNPLGPETGSEHVLRGGSRRDSEYWARSSARNSDRSTYYSRNIGFRCAQDVPQE